MLFKNLKHDLIFGRKMFFSLGIGLVLAAIAGQIAFRAMEDTELARNMINISMMLALGLVCGFVAVHFSQFVEKTLFGDSGYLTLTLPITRGRLLVSKLLACGVWYNFVLAVVVVALMILSGTQSAEDFTVFNIPEISPNLFAYYLNLAFGFFFLINLLLFGLTLHNSVFGRWKVPGFITSILSLTGALGYAIAMVRFMTRERERVTEIGTYILNGMEIQLPSEVWHYTIDLSVGRLPLFDSHFDLYAAATGLLLGAAAFLGTLYLLKKRVSLQ